MPPRAESNVHDNGLLETCRARLLRGELSADPAQAFAAEQLQLLANCLGDWQASRHRSVLDLLLGRKVDVPCGLYLFGGVGRGKTMLMDLFFETVPFAHKKRLHFHPFMRKVYPKHSKFPEKSVENRCVSTRHICPLQPSDEMEKISFIKSCRVRALVLSMILARWASTVLSEIPS